MRLTYTSKPTSKYEQDEMFVNVISTASRKALQNWVKNLGGLADGTNDELRNRVAAAVATGHWRFQN